MALADGSFLVLGAAEPPQPAWWLDPTRFLLLILLPIFCAASYSNRFSYWTYGSKQDFVTLETFSLGLLSIGLLVCGITLVRLAKPRPDFVSLIDVVRAQRVLMTIGWITVLAYAVFLVSLASDIDLVLAMLRGQGDVYNDVRALLGRIPGVTSLMQFGVVFLAALSALRVVGGLPISRNLRIMTITIIALTLMRVVLNSERLALLEALTVLFVCPIAFAWKPSFRRAAAPVAAVVFVFSMFAAAEFFRSWQYYKAFYDSYLDFITQRFLAYFSTGINNGAGTYTVYGQYNPSPEITVGWITRFPGMEALFTPPQYTLLGRYLTGYATPEYNNPGGLYAPFLDFRFSIAILFWLGLGVLVALSYRSLLKSHLIGLLLYPIMFLGLADLIRIVYVAETRTFPIFLGTAIVALALRPRRVSRSYALSAGLLPIKDAGISQGRSSVRGPQSA